jgi:hypothetical protein
MYFCPFSLSPLAKFIAPIINAAVTAIQPLYISQLNIVETLGQHQVAAKA